MSRSYTSRESCQPMLWNEVNHWLFSSQTCPLCTLSKNDEEPVCLGCYNDLPHNYTPCKQCAYPLPANAKECPECTDNEPLFEAAYSPFLYQFPLDQVFHAIKQGRNPEPLQWLSVLMAQKGSLKHFGHEPVLIPIPAHPVDQAIRGFNQADVIARQVSQRLGLCTVQDLLVKHHRTPHQADLNKQQRQHNLVDAFRVTGRSPKAVILIDDIHTTGSTFNRASQLLHDAGCQRVEAWSICRTPLSQPTSI